jgi:hypothetical protein
MMYTGRARVSCCATCCCWGLLIMRRPARQQQGTRVMGAVGLHCQVVCVSVETRSVERPHSCSRLLLGPSHPLHHSHNITPHPPGS